MKKELWIEKLRVFAAMAVVLLHVVQGTFVNGLDGIPVYRSIVDTAFLMSCCSWAVPVFVMISGYLLLNPEKELPLQKVKRYIGRVLLILVTLGFGFCLIESFLTYRSNGLGFVLRDAAVNLISARSWNHMWYLYMLVGLYILTPVLRAFVKDASEESANFVLLALFVFTLVVPTINRICGSKITNFYLFSSPYVFYYLSGYYLPRLRIPMKFVYIAGGFGFVVCLLTSAFDLQTKHPVFDYNNVFLALLSLSIFFVAYQKKDREIKNRRLEWLVNYISGASFCIYLVHTVFLNIVNKGLGLFVTDFPIVLGEALLFGISFLLSLLTYEITKKIFH